MEIAEELELDELRAHALNTMGVARATRGDRDGLADLERSIEIAVGASSPESVRGYFNLGSMLANFGDLRRAAELHTQARALADRYGDAAWTDWLEAERVYQHYWAGEWNEAEELAERLLGKAKDGASGRLELDGSLVSGWIALARGDVDAAVANADRADAFSRHADDPQNLYPALAFRARALLAAGRKRRGLAARSTCCSDRCGRCRPCPRSGSSTSSSPSTRSAEPTSSSRSQPSRRRRGGSTRRLLMPGATLPRPRRSVRRSAHDRTRRSQGSPQPRRASDGEAKSANESAAVAFFREVGADAYSAQARSGYSRSFSDELFSSRIWCAPNSSSTSRPCVAWSSGQMIVTDARRLYLPDSHETTTSQG